MRTPSYLFILFRCCVLLTLLLSSGSRLEVSAEHVDVFDASKDVYYRGSTNNGVQSFQGIFYGQDTSGANRFRPPQRVEVARGILINATTPGAACPQPLGPVPPGFAGTDTISENCLSLEVKRPDPYPSGRRLPVLVHIHGGGMIYGHASDAWYDTSNLVRMSASKSQPILTVAINYRLSVFGFAASQALKNAKAENIALRDQRLALEWIQDNIATFGGDPQQITVFGQSAGGYSVGVQQMAFGGVQQALFQQGIMMSTTPMQPVNYSSNDVAKHTAAVASRLGCSKSMEDESQGVIDCLRQIDMQTLLDTALKYMQEYHPPVGFFVFIPVVDGDFLPDRMSKLVHSGRMTKGISNIASWTQNDGTMISLPPNEVTDDLGVIKSISALHGMLAPEFLERLMSLYPVKDFEDQARSTGHPESAQYFRAARIQRDITLTCPAIDFTFNVYKHSTPNVRLYDFNQSNMDEFYAAAGITHWRATHGADLPYFLHLLDAPGKSTPPDEMLATDFGNTVIDFVTDVNANLSPRSPDEQPSFLHDWPLAFGPSGRYSPDDEMPDELDVLVIGGPFGTHPIKVSSASAAQRDGVAGASSYREKPMVSQISTSILDAARSWLTASSAMQSREQQLQTQEIAKERLIERCGFVNTLIDQYGT